MSTISDAFRKDRYVYPVVELDFEGWKKYYSTATLHIPNADGDTIHCQNKLLTKGMTVGQNFDFSSFRYSTNDVSLSIINDDRFQDNEVHRNLDRGTGRIWLWSESLDFTDIEEKPILRGKFRKDKHTNAEYSFSLADFAQVATKEISGATYTGTPSFNLERVLKRYTTVMNDEIDYGSLENMDQLLSGASCFTLVNDTSDGFSIIDRIGSQFLCPRIMRDGKVGVVAFNLNRRPKRLIGQSEYLYQRPVLGATDYNLVCNNLEVSFGRVTGSTGWKGTLTYDKDNNSKCKNSYYFYEEMEQKQLSLADSATTSTATIAAMRYLDWFALRHDTVSVVVPHHIGFDLVEGDVAELEVEDAPSVSGDGWANEPCMLVQRKFRTAGVEQLWWRIATGRSSYEA